MSTSAFYEADFAAALFPLQMNLLMVKHHEKELSDYVYQSVLNHSIADHSFLPQQRVHATKPRAHLRRTVKLDPVAEYFLYDLIYRNRALEYQVFWLAKLVEERLLKTKPCGDLFMGLYERSTPHAIACAKILEIPDQRFGFKEIRADHLKTGASNWLTWASAFGSRSLPKAERNYALAYFSKCSPLNHLVAGCVSKL